MPAFASSARRGRRFFKNVSIDDVIPNIELDEPHNLRHCRESPVVASGLVPVQNPVCGKYASSSDRGNFGNLLERPCVPQEAYDTEVNEHGSKATASQSKAELYHENWCDFQIR